MEIASVVLKHNFDRAMLDQIDTLRTIRLNLAERMLSDLQKTTADLQERGLAGDRVDVDELRKELIERVTTLRERIQRPDVVYSDEINLYVDLLDADSEIEEAVE
jgi:hypothetical protein